MCSGPAVVHCPNVLYDPYPVAVGAGAGVPVRPLYSVLTMFSLTLSQW